MLVMWLWMQDDKDDLTGMMEKQQRDPQIRWACFHGTENLFLSLKNLYSHRYARKQELYFSLGNPDSSSGSSAANSSGME